MEDFTKKFYKVSGGRFYELLMAEAKLMALEDGGVDNWSGYEQAHDSYIETNYKLYDPIYRLDIPEEAKENFYLFADWEAREIIKSYAECE